MKTNNCLLGSKSVVKGALFGKKESGNLDLLDMDPSPLNNNNINNNNVNNNNKLLLTTKLTIKSYLQNTTYKSLHFD